MKLVNAHGLARVNAAGIMLWLRLIERVPMFKQMAGAPPAPAWLTGLTWIELRIIVPVTVALTLESMKGLGLKAIGIAARRLRGGLHVVS